MKIVILSGTPKTEGLSVSCVAAAAAGAEKAGRLSWSLICVKLRSNAARSAEMGGAFAGRSMSARMGKIGLTRFQERSRKRTHWSYKPRSIGAKRAKH